MTLKRTPLRRTELKRGTKPLAKISPRKIQVIEAQKGTGMSLWSVWTAYQIQKKYGKKAIFNNYELHLKRGKPLNKTVLRRITPKQQKRLRKQSQDKQEALKQMDGLCPKCGRPFTVINPADMDHIVQRGKGGANEKQNKRIQCRFCHDRRHNGTAREQHPENFS